MKRLGARLADAAPVAVAGAAAFTVPRSEGIEQAVGPWIFPWVAGGGLLLCSAFLAFEKSPATTEPDLETRRGAAVWLLSAALSYIVLISLFGFIPAASVAFFFVTRAFGSPRPVRDAITGILFAVASHGLFTTLLGVRLGAAFTLWS